MIGELQLPDAVRYVPAMIKALLKSPSEYVKNGFVEMFNSSDYASLGVKGRNRVHAVSAHVLMNEASEYVAAYSRLDEVQRQTIINDTEVRMVMHVHQKRASTRTDFKSLKMICVQMRLDMIKAGDNVPEWRLVKNEPNAASTERQGASHGLKEIRNDGIVSDKDLSDNGFMVGTHVVSRVGDDQKPRVYKIIGLKQPNSVSLERVDDHDDDAESGSEKTELDRNEVLAKWKVKEIHADEVAHSINPSTPIH